MLAALAEHRLLMLGERAPLLPFQFRDGIVGLAFSAIDADLPPAENSALAIENADLRLVHRDIEASKIVHRMVSSSEPKPILSASTEEPRPITRC